MLDAAHAAARRGRRVMPLHSIGPDGCCTCWKRGGCLTPGKHPRHTSWPEEASTSGADIEEWWDAHPDANLGVATGAESGFFTTDVDDYHDGGVTLGKLIAEHGPLPPTRMIRTGSGSIHYEWAYPDFPVISGTSILGKGIDTRGAGGMVVAPPSISGKGPYVVMDDRDPAPAPDWMLDTLRPLAERVGGGPTAPVAAGEHVDQATIPARLAELLSVMLSDGEGRHRHFYRIVAEARRAGYTQGQATTLAGQWDAKVGKFGPRVAAQVATVWTKLDAEQAAITFTMPDAAAPQFTQPAEIPSADTGGMALEMSRFLAQPEPEYDWLVPGLLERGDRVIWTGEEGGGKSTLLRQMGVQLASGIHPFGGGAFQPIRVLLVDLENSAAQIRRKLKPLSLSARDTYKPVPGFHIMPRPQGIDMLNVTDRLWLHTQIEDVGPDLLIIGPIYKMHSGSATDEEPARGVSIALDQIRSTYRVALMMEAHTPYATGKGPRPKRPYGASLWSRWPEFGIFLSPEGVISHWRGARDEREWPSALKRGGEWPWTASSRGRDSVWSRISDACREAGDQLSERDLAKLADCSQATVHRAIGEHRAEWERLKGEAA
jgi:hypothetical protein